jgi:four helix bundle suffix protein
MNNSFLPKKGGYKQLLSYQKSIIIYECTYIFCGRFFGKYDRTIDQMVQAARSCKQNIVEGSRAGIASAETELKLTNVARASLEELLEDYQDFLRVHEQKQWNKQDHAASYVRKLSSRKIDLAKTLHESGLEETNDDVENLRQIFVYFLKTRSSDVCANIMICLIHQCNYLLDQQIRRLEDDFVKSGGIRENMLKARVDYKRNNR